MRPYEFSTLRRRVQRRLFFGMKKSNTYILDRSLQPAKDTSALKPHGRRLRAGTVRRAGDGARNQIVPFWRVREVNFVHLRLLFVRLWTAVPPPPVDVVRPRVLTAKALWPNARLMVARPFSAEIPPPVFVYAQWKIPALTIIKM